MQTTADIRPRSKKKSQGLRPESLGQAEEIYSGAPVSSARPRFLGTRVAGQVLQPKLTINPTGDVYEQEADQVADQVMRMPEPRHAAAVSGTPPPGVQRKCSCGGTCSACQAEEQDERGPRLQMKSAAPGSAGLSSAPPSVHQVVRSPGQPLGAAERAFMEPRFGRDFSDVRVHTGSDAAESAAQIQARAYTTGNHVVFAGNQFDPATAEGRKLLAHELTHVAQQGDSHGIIQRAPWGECPAGTHVPADNFLIYGAAEANAVFQYREQFGNHCVITNRDFAEGAYPHCNPDEQPIVDDLFQGFHSNFVSKRTVAPAGDVTRRAEEDKKIVAAREEAAATKEPDILDVTDRQVYDVTTTGQRWAKRRKVNEVYLPLLHDATDVTWSAGTNMQPVNPLTFQIHNNMQICYGDTDFDFWPGVIQYDVIAKPDEEPEEKEPKNQEPGSNDTLPEKLLKLGEEAVKVLAAAGLLEAAFAIASTMAAVLTSPFLALAAVILGIAFFWDEFKAIAAKIAGAAGWLWDKITALAGWVWDKYMWLIHKIEWLGIKIAELGNWLAGKIKWLVGKLVEGVKWAAGKVVSGAKWVGRQIASGAKAVWDWLFGSDVEPTVPVIDMPVTEDTEHCALVAHEDAIVKIGADLLFEFNHSDLKEGADESLDAAATTILSMLQSKDDHVYIGGYTDNIGSEEYNQGLSERRAEAVAKWFVDNHKFPRSIIETVGYGKTQAQYNDEEGRKKDRRVEIWATKHGSVEKQCW